MPRTAPRHPAGYALVGCVLLAGLAACTADAPADPGLAVSRGVCAQDWHPAHGGTQTLLLHNTGTETLEVYLVDPASGGVYAEVEALAPGTSRPMRVALGPGRYALRCVSEGSDAITGPTVTIVDGTVAPDVASAVLPVTEQDLAPAVISYRAYVSAGLDTLAGTVADLRAAVGSGDTARVRAAWLTAHLAYQRLGAAYDTFGDLGDAIDGTPDGLPGGVADPDFTGFRRIEYGLWHGEPLPALAPVADQLVADVAALRAQFPSSRTDPNDLPLRAHEILEDGVQFELTGAADLGSGSGLATLAANLDGTGAVMDALAPVLAARYPDWSRTKDWLDQARTLVAAQHHPDGTWTAPAALSPTDRRALDGTFGQLLELLAPIAAIGEVRRTS